MSYRSSSSLTGSAKVRRKTVLSLSPISIDIDEGEPSLIEGKLMEASGPSQGKGIPGKNIQLFVGGSEVARVVTAQDGSYKLTYTWETAGEYEYLTKYAGD